MFVSHSYSVHLAWTGDCGFGTETYEGYSRDHELSAGAKPTIPGSSDRAFRGDAARWNPEDLLVAALSACHQLAYLALCARAGVPVVAYSDDASGTMVEAGGGGRFTLVVLRPRVSVRAGGDISLAERLHHDAHEQCFIANSVNFPVTCEPQVTSAPV